MILIQEIDVHSSRSNRVNELDYLAKHLSDFSDTFAVNYKVPWVPVPLTHRMGAVRCGLATFSKFNL